jgi:hypothetical protein
MGSTKFFDIAAPLFQYVSLWALPPTIYMLFLMCIYTYAMPHKPLNMVRVHSKVVCVCVLSHVICTWGVHVMMVTEECRVYINEMINFLVLFMNRYLL